MGFALTRGEIDSRQAVLTRDTELPREMGPFSDSSPGAMEHRWMLMTCFLRRDEGSVLANIGTVFVFHISPGEPWSVSH